MYPCCTFQGGMWDFLDCQEVGTKSRPTSSFEPGHGVVVFTVRYLWTSSKFGVPDIGMNSLSDRPLLGNDRVNCHCGRDVCWSSEASSLRRSHESPSVFCGETGGRSSYSLWTKEFTEKGSTEVRTIWVTSDSYDDFSCLFYR